MQLVWSDKVTCNDGCLAISTMHAPDARNAPILRPMHAQRR